MIGCWKMLDREEIIRQIRADIHYYNQFDKPLDKLDDQQYYSVIALQDLLKQIEQQDEVFDIREKVLTPEELANFTRLEDSDESK